MKVIDGVQSAPAGVRVFVRGMPEGAQAKYAIGGRTEVLSTASVCDADAREGRGERHRGTVQHDAVNGQSNKTARVVADTYLRRVHGA